MTGLNKEEMDEFFNNWEKQHKLDVAWLKERGWIEQLPDNPKEESSTWTHPKHGDKVYTWLHNQVVDTAEMDLVYELGWESITQHTLIPEYLGCNGDYSNLKYKEDSCHDGSKKPLLWARYVHPSGKIYTYLEAAEIARYYNNSIEEWLAAGNIPSGWSQEVQALLDDRKLKQGDVIWLKFGPRNAPTDMDNHYSLTDETASNGLD
jgi:hypothetical protein